MCAVHARNYSCFPVRQKVWIIDRMSTIMAPTSSGIGAPGTAPAPASLARSPMASQPGQQAASAIPFARASTTATMRDATLVLAAGSQGSVQLQTNAFLADVVMDVSFAVTGNTATVVQGPTNSTGGDSPWQIISQIRLDDPAGQSIIAPISGYHLYLLNKYLPDTNCRFDPKADPNYSFTSGSGPTAGSFSFRLVLPIEHRHRDALGALNNSAANQRYLITVNTIASFASLYTTPPTTLPNTVAINFYQDYWTSPPSSITSSSGSSPTQTTPAGLGTVGFVRYERHNEINGGGSPQIQLNNVGDYISAIIFVLRDSSGYRDINAGPQSASNANMTPEFDWWVNDFQVHALSTQGPGGANGGVWPRAMARFYGYENAIETTKGIDNGVYVLYHPYGTFDRCENFGPANQYLPTDATTKLQIRGSQWGSGAANLEVITRMIRPVSGAALFA